MVYVLPRQFFEFVYAHALAQNINILLYCTSFIQYSMKI